MYRLPASLLPALRVLGLLAAFFVLTETAMRVQRFGAAGLSPWEMSTIKRVLMSEFAIEPPRRNQRTTGSWGLMPNTRGWNKGERFEVNNLGLRGEDTTEHKPEGVLRVAAVGGSLTMAAGVPLADTWTEALEEQLNRTRGSEGTWEILNLGVPNTRRCLERHLNRALRFEPDLILFQIGWVGPPRQFELNLQRAREFAERRSIPLYAFALNEDQYVAEQGRFFELLPPLGVLYGPENYIYPSDDHPDGEIHRRYAERLHTLIDARRPQLLALMAETEPDHSTFYHQPPLRPWVDPDRGFWHCYLWERASTSLSDTAKNIRSIGDRMAWSEKRRG